MRRIILFYVTLLCSYNEHLYAQSSEVPSDAYKIQTETSISEAEALKRLTSQLQPEYNGYIIKSITIKHLDVFEEENLEFPYDLINKSKIDTSNDLIKRELRFKVGEKYDDFTVRETARQLRALRYLRDAVIHATKVPSENSVDITVMVKETWTLIPRLSYSSTSGQKATTYGLIDGNFLGLGKKLEIMHRQVEDRESLEFSYDDTRAFNSYHQLTVTNIDRSDGRERFFRVGRPFLSLLDNFSWDFAVDDIDSIGRIFENGEESIIYRRTALDLSFRGSVSVVNTEVLTERFTFGFQYLDEDFGQASASDFEDVDLDPNEVSSDPDFIASDRRFIGPRIGIERIIPDFISMNYIDRFDRFEDYNLGHASNVDLFFPLEAFNSYSDSLILNLNHGFGFRINEGFWRFSVGTNGRIGQKRSENWLTRFETKMFKRLGRQNLIFDLGDHTFASNFIFDLGSSLDPDRQLLLGGADGLRGYKAQAFQGDRRFILNLEDRIHLFENVGKILSIGAVTFLDVGGNTDDSVRKLFSDRVYGDIGVGLRLAFPRSNGGGVMRFDVAWPLRDAEDGSQAFSPRFLFSAGQAFGARTRSETLGTDKADLDVGFQR